MVLTPSCEYDFAFLSSLFSCFLPCCSLFVFPPPLPSSCRYLFLCVASRVQQASVPLEPVCFITCRNLSEVLASLVFCFIPYFCSPLCCVFVLISWSGLCCCNFVSGTLASHLLYPFVRDEVRFVFPSTSQPVATELLPLYDKESGRTLGVLVQLGIQNGLM